MEYSIEQNKQNTNTQKNTHPQETHILVEDILEKKKNSMLDDDKW